MFAKVLKNSCFCRDAWCLGKAANPVVTLERATENKGNVSHPAVLLVSGLLVTLLHQGRAFHRNLDGSRHRGAALSDA